MKKIFVVIGSLGIGGTEKQLLMKMKYLKDKYDFTVIIFFQKGDLHNSFKKMGIKVVDFRNSSGNLLWKYASILIKFFLYIKKKKPKIINLYLPHSYLIFGFFSYIFPNIKFFMSRRSLNNYQKKIPLIRFVEKYILHRKMKTILVNSNAIRNELIKSERVKKDKIKLIYNSVEIQKINKQSNVKINILHLANLIPYKNHKLVIKACNEIKSIANYTIHFVGDGEPEYKIELQKEIEKYGLSNKIKFHGKVKNYLEVTKGANIGILSSNEEGFSNAILEYLAQGIPVISTNVGGNSEIIDHNKNGFLVKKNDYVEFSKYMKILITNRKLRIKFGKCGFEKVKKDFTITNNMEKYNNFYKNS